MNRDRSLEDLERDRWAAPSAGETRLTATVRELRRKPIGSLTVEDMRLLIRQDVGLAYVLPLAVEALRVGPLAEGDMYEGDLLAAVLTRSAEVWSERPDLRRDVRLAISGLADIPPALAREVEAFLALQCCDRKGSPGCLAGSPHAG
ncbi:contact-dependent growth inhibition system immunity protein [Kitasatospora sp. NPDC051705]|uniref:contact-dependent growth inhibition system immunity protein n=1 Tax=Kitasatospora sp. NPDC051705 TaxID=3364057 RepID=UPI0037AE21B8